MSTFLYRLGRFCYRRKGVVIGGWLGVLVVVAVVALGVMKPFSSSTTIPGTEAQRTLDVLEKEFPPADRGHVTQDRLQGCRGSEDRRRSAREGGRRCCPSS
ncbi:hypothetical protein ABZ935_02470 [Streptomyces coeruleorubidus]